MNEEILANTATDARVMDIESAQKTGAMMLFGEKYGETVRVLDIGTSRELCGGTHVQRTGDIGLFKIVAEGGVAAGIRRVEAVTGGNALAYLQQNAAGTAPVEYDTRIDSIRFNDLLIPHVGQANAVACTWTGDWIFSYAAESWNGAFDVACGNERYRLEGNMSLNAAPAGAGHNQEYVVNLVVPGIGGAGGDPFAAPDPFATVDGITGTLAMSNSGRATEDGVYTNVAVTGQLVGTNVPLEVVRGWGQIIAILGRSFMGA